ncbi:MAG: TrmH family RNA methyltransferase [Bilophila wadsworthia]
MITEKNTSPRKAFRSAPKAFEQDASLENASCSDSKEEQAVLSGVKPVLELLEREPERIDAVLVRKGKRSQDTDRILDLCRTAKVRFTLADAQSLDRLCPAGHQGVVARLFEAGFTEFDHSRTHGRSLPLILVRSGVDPAGPARTYTMGGAGLVIPRHNGTFLGAGARRAAAGALERLPVAKVMNIARALDEARDAGFLIYGAAFGEGSLDAFTTRLHTPALLVLGNEEHGIRPQVAKRCHHLLHIPMLRTFDSLNVAQAGGILTSCFVRQHLEKNPSGE